MKLLLLNQDWLAEEFKAAGHTVVTCGIYPHLDIRIDQPVVSIFGIIDALSPELRPDVLIVWDNSAPLMVTGLDEIDIPSIFYSVDTHHHADFHRYLAHLFDDTLVAQKDYLPAILSAGTDAIWMPLWASRHVEPAKVKTRGAVFVGTLSSKLNPDRVTFFSALKEKVPVHFEMGAWWNIFDSSRIVINQTVKGDLNFRVFEAMMSGALLLTEKTGNGLFELFDDGRHLATYTRNDTDEAAERIRALLADPALCQTIADTGRAEVLAKHTPAHRAEFLLNRITGLQLRKSFRHFAALVNFESLARRFEKVERVNTAHALIAAVKSCEAGLEAREPLNLDVAVHATIACAKYDQYIGTGAGLSLLHRLNEAYPEMKIFSLARIRAHLNRGEYAAAAAIAGEITNAEHSFIFSQAEELITGLLEM